MSTPDVAALLAEAAARLAGDEAALEAEQLLLHVLGRSRAWLYAHRDAPVAAEQVDAFRALLAQRAAGRPVAHLLGRRGFWSLDLAVTADTLIPRPDTECLVEAALARAPAERRLRIADLGTGSGAIALALATERPQAWLVAVDASRAALTVAAGNARRLGVGNVAFVASDWFTALAGSPFDLIVGNPPYIADDDLHLGRGDLRFEPRTALASGADGLDAIRQIAAAAPARLRPGGWLLLEHGFDQGAAVRALLAAAGLVEVATLPDLERRDRVTLGRRPG